MQCPAHAPEQSARRSRGTNQRHQRYGIHYGEFSSLRTEVESVGTAGPVSIVLIDPKPLTRRSLIEMLANTLPNHVMLTGVSSYEELTGDQNNLLEITAGSHLIIILYIRNAGVSGTWVQDQLQLIRLRASETVVIMISDRDDAEDVIDALNCGVRGYIPTSIAAEVAIAALTLIEAGGTFIPVGALQPGGVQPDTAADEPARAPETLNLTSREMAVIDLLREGKPNKVIAIQLKMRESTVKVHVRNILKKLRASNRTHAATVANRLLAQTDLVTNVLSITTDDTPGRPH
jgi:DNA-binding NarL/FixJ family response regulator